MDRCRSGGPRVGAAAAGEVFPERPAATAAQEDPQPHRFQAPAPFGAVERENTEEVVIFDIRYSIYAVCGRSLSKCDPFMKLAIFSIISCLFVAGCGQQSNQPSPAASKQTIRTDAAPITKRLPKLGQLQSVWWTSTKATTDSFLSPPSQPSYIVRGFAQLEKGVADELSQQFQWQHAPPGWKPAFTVTNLNLDSAEWSQSTAFTKDCKPQQIPGELFFERQKGVVYFDLEIE
jgi:hypothetical protein